MIVTFHFGRYSASLWTFFIRFSSCRF